MPGVALTLEELQRQVDHAAPGQTLGVPAGTYRGELVIRQPVVLRAQPGARLVHSPGTGRPTLSIEASDVTVEGLVIDGAGEGTRRDHTAIVVTGSRVVLRGLRVLNAWSGVWLDRGDGVTVQDLEVTGWSDYPFWERGEGVRITGGTNIRLRALRLAAVADGVYSEKSTGIDVDDCRVEDARYGFHTMFSSQGTITRLVTLRTVCGLMVMESNDWTVRDGRFTDGFRTGSAGVRQIRTKAIRVFDTLVSRQASGVELLDVRDGLFAGNRITENGVAWAWGGDNSGTVVTGNRHQGNVVDFAGGETLERSLRGTSAHNHEASPTPTPTVPVTTVRARPRFDRNGWDAWVGTDLDHDGVGDTPYRFDAEAAQAATRPWVGVFLGSPWTQWSRTIPGGVVIDEHPKTR